MRLNNILTNKRLRGKNVEQIWDLLFLERHWKSSRQSLCLLNGPQIYGKLFLSRRKRISENYSSRQRLESGKHLTCINISEHNLFLWQNEAAKCRGVISHPQNDNKKIKYTFYCFSANLSCRERDSCLLKCWSGQVGSVCMVLMGWITKASRFWWLMGCCGGGRGFEGNLWILMEKVEFWTHDFFRQFNKDYKFYTSFAKICLLVKIISSRSTFLKINAWTHV